MKIEITQWLEEPLLPPGHTPVTHRHFSSNHSPLRGVTEYVDDPFKTCHICSYTLNF